MSNLAEKTKNMNEEIKALMVFSSNRLIQNRFDLKAINSKLIEEMQIEFRTLDIFMEVCLEQAKVIDKMEKDLETIKEYLIEKR